MKRLIWKELMESRFIPVGYAALVTVVLLLWFSMCSWTAAHGGMASDRMNVDEALFVVIAGIILSGLIPGSSTIASEAGQGTSGFLASLPTGRLRIWMAKALGSLAITLATIIVVAAVSTVIVSVLFRSAPASDELTRLVSEYFPPGWGYTPVLLWAGLGASSLLCFSVALFCSNLTDRPLASGGTALIVTLVTFFAVDKAAAFVQQCDFTDALYTWGIPVYATVCFLVASACGFRAGAGNGSKRYVGRGSLTLVCGLAVGAGLLLFTGYLEDLALQSFPTPVLRSPGSAMPTGPLDNPKFANRYERAVVFQRVQIGHVYRDVDEVPFAGGIGPLHLVSSSPELHGALYRFRRLDINHHPEYFVAYYYTPSRPFGNDTQELEVVGAQGQVLGAIVLHARKAAGIFPPINWFLFDYDGYVDVWLKHGVPIMQPGGLKQVTT